MKKRKWYYYIWIEHYLPYMTNDGNKLKGKGWCDNTDNKTKDPYITKQEDGCTTMYVEVLGDDPWDGDSALVSEDSIYIRFIKEMESLGSVEKAAESLGISIEKVPFKLKGLYVTVYKTFQEIGKELMDIQSKKNDGRGISCIRTVASYLERYKWYDAQSCVRNEWDKISAYPDIKEYCTTHKLYPYGSI